MRELRRQFAITQDRAKGIQPHKQVSRVSRSIEFVISVQFSTTATCKLRFQQYVVLSPSDISHCLRCHLYDIR